MNIPVEVYQEAGLASYDNRQLIQELHRRHVSEHTILGAMYELDAIADARTDNEVYS